MFIWRTKLLSLAILILLALIGALLFVNDLSTRNWLAYTLLRTLAWQVIAMLLKKDQSSDLKIPWIIFLALTPIVGMVMYYLFGTVHVGKLFKKRYDQVYQDCAPFMPDQSKVYHKLEQENPIASSYAYYVKKCGRMDLYQNTSSVYYSTGYAYFSAIKEAMKKAKKFIFLEFFIIAQGRLFDEIFEILKQKAKEVKVVIIYDDVGSMKSLPRNFSKLMEEWNIEAIAFHHFKPLLSLTYNNRNHRKGVYIDGDIAFIGGANLADEYVGYKIKYGDFKDTGLKIVGEAVRGLILLFCQTYHGSTNKKLACVECLQLEEKVYDFDVHNYVLPFGDGPYDLYKERISETVYMNVINQSVDYLYIMTPYLICDYYIILALKNAALRGVDVRIIMPGIPDKRLVYYFSKSSFCSLIEKGVKIYYYTPGFIHAKTIVSDGNVAIVGSINFDFRSFIHHLESAVLLYNGKTIKDIEKDFLKIIEKSQLITYEQAQLKWYELIVRNTFILFKPLF